VAIVERKTMRLIQPNCRAQFTAQDVEFILEVLGRRVSAAEALVKLLADESSRDDILDDEALFRAVLERRDCLRISSRLYFYVLVRNVFRRSDIDDREVADYVAEVLAAFSDARRSQCIVPGQPNPLDYVFEMMSALQTADERTSFLLRMHIGNHSLFMSGVFPDRIRFRAESRGFPDIKYYEDLGRTHYRLAGDHRLAQRYQMEGILKTLAERFLETRRALNDMTERLISLGDAEFPLAKLLGQS
jgi:hypothetical protein